jgi:predicted DNA-binding transcriptional regulator AlpA
MREISNPLLSTREAADHLRNSPRTFIRWRGLGLGPPYIRVGGKVRYLRSDLDEWLARNRVHPVREGRSLDPGRANPRGRGISKPVPTDNPLKPPQNPAAGRSSFSSQ